AICRMRPNTEIVSQCSDGLAAFDAIQSLVPDIAILDLDLPKLLGLEVARQVRQTNAHTRIIVLSGGRDAKAATEVFRLGANGFLPKDGPAQHLLDAIERTMEHGIYVSPLIEASRVFKFDQEIPNTDVLDTLSTREYEVFLLLVEGLERQEIARRLGISP